MKALKVALSFNPQRVDLTFQRIKHGGGTLRPAPVLFFISLFALTFHSSHLFAQEFKLTLEDTLQLALKNNSKIQQAQIDTQIAQAEADSAGFDFDYQTTLALPYKKTISLSMYTYDDAVITEKSYGISGGIKTKTRIGTELAAVVQSLKINTTSTQSSLQERSQIAASLKITQPLLKGAGRDVNEAIERHAKASLEKYNQKLRETTQEQLLKIGGYFWDLYESHHEFALAKESRKRAQEIFNSEKAGFEMGRKSNLDYLKAKANEALSEAKVILAESHFLEAEEKIAREIFPLTETKINFSLVPLVPIMETSELFKREKSLLSLDLSALSTHPKISRLTQEVIESEIDLKKSDHNRLPQLDLSVETISTGVNAQTSSAFNQVSKLNTPSLEIVLSLTFPLGGYAASGDYIEKKSAHATKDVTLEKEKKSMESTLTSSKESLQKNIIVLESLRSRIKIEKRKLEAKESLFSAGRLNWQEYLDGLEDYQELLKNECTQFVTLQKSFLKLDEVFSQILIK